MVTNAGEKTGRRLAWRFEQVRAAYQTLWPWAHLEFGRPVIVLAARDEVQARKRSRAGLARARQLLKQACDGGESDACSMLASLPKGP